MLFTRRLIPLLLFLPASCVMSQVQYVEVDADPPAEGQTPDVVDLGHVFSDSWGLLVFAKLPYLSGGIDEDGQPVWVYFEDHANVQTVVDLIRAEARRRGATHLIDLKSDWISEWASPSLIFWISEASASATAIKVTGVAPKGAMPL